MEPYEKVANPSKKQLMLNNFLGGLSWAFGTTVGFGILLLVIGFVLQQIGIVPILGDFFSDVMRASLEQTQPKLFGPTF